MTQNMTGLATCIVRYQKDGFLSGQTELEKTRERCGADSQNQSVKYRLIFLCIQQYVSWE